VRSPAEFLDDHIPGAINVPVVNDRELAEFDAKAQADLEAAELAGVAAATRNIQIQMTNELVSTGADVEYLIYSRCGGMRSRLFAAALRRRGVIFDVLPGGWRAYRRWVQRSIVRGWRPVRLRVLCGPTGSGQNRLLNALDDAGEQVVNLRSMAARHRPWKGWCAVSSRHRDSSIASVDVCASSIPPGPSGSKRSANGSAACLCRRASSPLAALTAGVLDAPISERVIRWREEHPAIKFAKPDSLLTNPTGSSAIAGCSSRQRITRSEIGAS